MKEPALSERALESSAGTILEKNGIPVVSEQWISRTEYRIRILLTRDILSLRRFTIAYVELLKSFPEQERAIILGSEEWRIFTCEETWKKILASNVGKKLLNWKETVETYKNIDTIREEFRSSLEQYWKKDTFRLEQETPWEEEEYMSSEDKDSLN